MSTTLSLWRFAVDRYARPQVRQHCLQLQDMHGLSVNWLLWLLWLEAQGRQATPALLDRAEADTGRLRRQLIEPLRQMRRSLDQQDEAPLGSQLGRVELTAERLELRRLQRLRPLAVPITAVDNLHGYLHWLAPVDPAPIEPLLAALRLRVLADPTPSLQNGAPPS